MDYQAEQEQELEVLESIYPDELTILNVTFPDVKFTVLLRLDLNDAVIDDTDLLLSLSKVHYLEVTFQFPDNYPDIAPVIHITPMEESLNEEDSDDEEEEEEDEYDEHGNIVLSKLDNLADQISFKDYINILTNKIKQQIDDDMLIGMQMCFALLATIKEDSENWFLEQLKELDKQHTLEIERREAQEQKKFNGTSVTKESYLEWRSKFRKEMGLDERDKLRRLEAHNGKLTGKQMFEQGVAGTTDDTDDGTIESMTKEMENVEI